jgi:hypothetical protein
MKHKLQFIITAIIALVIYTSAIYGQAKLTFSGGNNSKLSITLTQPVTYSITNSNCSSATLFFVFDETGNPFLNTSSNVTGTITYSVNGGAPQPFTFAASGSTSNEVSTNDIYLNNSNTSGAPNTSTVVLSAGTITTSNNIIAPPPANGSYTTFITNISGNRCSNVVGGTTAASVSVSGKVTTASGRGIRNVMITMIDSQGIVRTAQTTAFGYYRFDDVAAGETVTLTAKAKQFRFDQSTIVRTTNESITDADFVSEK